MPLWQVDIEKVLLGEYWTNRYIVEAADLAAAAIVGDNIVEIEQSVHYNIVTFTKVRTSDRVPLTDVYAIRSINQPGILAGLTDYLPLFNVVRVDFTTIGGGRPSRKYLKMPVPESAQSNGVLAPAFVTQVQADYADLMADLEGYVDVDGQLFSSGSVSPFVGMRQLRRGSKRRAVPVIPEP